MVCGVVIGMVLSVGMKGIVERTARLAGTRYPGLLIFSIYKVPVLHFDEINETCTPAVSML